MSVTLPITDLSTASINTTGTVDWATQVSSEQYKATADNPPHLWIFNESNCGLQLTFQSGEKPFIPAGGWVAVDLNPTCLFYTWQVVYVMAGPLVTSLVTVWFAPDEPLPRLPALGNSPIGASVGISTAENLEGSGQLHAVTTLDDGATGPILIPVAPSGPVTLELGGANAANSWGVDIICHGGTIDIVRVADYNGEVTQGVGVPPIVGSSVHAAITATGAINLFSYATPNDGVAHSYRVGASLVLNNAVSGNNVAFTYSYTDRNGNVRTMPFIGHVQGGTAFSFMAGTAPMANNTYSVLMEEICASANTVITISYNDPTNTPNDKVGATLERLS